MVLRIYIVFLCLLFTFPIFINAAAAIKKEDCLLKLVQEGNPKRINSFIKKQRDRVNYYDKAIEYSNNINNKELAEKLHVSKIREQERKSKSVFQRNQFVKDAL